MSHRAFEFIAVLGGVALCYAAVICFCFWWMLSRRTKRLRFQVNHTALSPTGAPAVALGLRVGYWPCLGGPFVQLALATRRYDLWYGRPSYRGVATECRDLRRRLREHL